MSNQARLDQAVARVVPLCFPRWRTHEKWRFFWGICPSQVRAEGELWGFCDHLEKAIFISREGNRDQLDSVVAHQITHAVTREMLHGQDFLRRLRAAASIARKQGRSALADQIAKDIVQYQAFENSPRNRLIPDRIAGFGMPTDEGIYAGIREVAMENQLSFENVVLFVSYKFGMRSRDILWMFRQARNVYETAIREREESAVK